MGLTSNKGSKDFQFTQDSNGTPLYESVLRKSANWVDDSNTMYVVGVTQGQMFKEIRQIIPNHFLLVPGVGAQVCILQEVAKSVITPDFGLMVNSSLVIILASSHRDFSVFASFLA